MISYRTVIVTVLIAILAGTGFSQVDEQEKPEALAYEMTPGKKMFYTSRTRLDHSGGTLESNETLEIWVVRQNADSSWRLLIHNSERSINVDAEGKETEFPPGSAWGMCDLYPNGRFARNLSMDNLSRFNLYLPNIFVPLPPDLSQPSLEWEFTDRPYGEKDRYTASRPVVEERSWIIDARHDSPLDDIYLQDNKAEIYVDLVSAIPVYKKGESRRGFGRYAGTAVTTVILDSVVDLDTVAASRFARDLSNLFAADSQYSEIIGRIEADPVELVPLRQDAESMFSALKTRITTRAGMDMLNEMITALPDDFDDLTADIRQWSKIVNKAAPAWRADGLDGKQHSSEDLTGKVVLLDFWYRACPWCMRSMPLIEEVALHFKDKPVVVVGVNVDKEKSDGLFVIQRMNPGYVNINSRDLAGKFGVTGYPTFAIIDRKGFIRRIVVGYENTLDRKIIRIIESLL